MAVAVKVTVWPPAASCDCAVTVTVPGVPGSVRFTAATPLALVVAITFKPLEMPFDKVPAEVENRISALEGKRPD